MASVNEFIAYTDDTGMNHYYYGPPVLRKLGDMDTAFEAIAKQEKERELDSYISGPFNVERDHRDYWEYRVALPNGKVEKFHSSEDGTDALKEKARNWLSRYLEKEANHK